MMAAHLALEQQILALIRSMVEEGVISSNFKEVREMKELNSPFYFAELISDFCSSAESMMTKISDALLKREVDYEQINNYSIKIEGTSGSFGFLRMTPACTELRKASDIKSRNGCQLAVTAIREAYVDLKEKLDVFIQLEWKIITGPFQ